MLTLRSLAKMIVTGMAALAGMKLAASVFDRSVNGTTGGNPPDVPDDSQEDPRCPNVVDLHCDTLLWQRNLLVRHAYGHVDLPRLRQGRVCLQVFGAVTQIPADINFERTRSKIDALPALAITQLWPPCTWFSPYQRALYLAHRLNSFVERSQGRLIWVRSRQDVELLIQRRADGETVMGAFLCLEGAHGLEGNLARLEALYQNGYRMLGLTHFFDNQAAGSAHGAQKGGLTDFGRALIAAAQDRNIIIDLAHASPRAFDEALEISRGPMLVSHTGVSGSYDSPRNLSDGQLDRIAARGGLVGIAFFKEAVGGETLAHIVRAIRYTIDRIGDEHVAIGSDFDGVVRAPFDSAGFGYLSRALLESGLSPDTVQRVMGGNALHFLSQNLPDGTV